MRNGGNLRNIARNLGNLRNIAHNELCKCGRDRKWIQSGLNADRTKPDCIRIKCRRAFRICLDPQDPNHAIRREHYPLPTIEDVATQLHGATVFTVLDVSKGFWHIELDEPSSFLMTFHTPFGRYRWK